MPLSHLKSGLKQQKCGFDPANDCPHPFPVFDKSAHDAELLLMPPVWSIHALSGASCAELLARVPAAPPLDGAG